MAASQTLAILVTMLLGLLVVAEAHAERIGARARIEFKQGVPYMELAVGTPPHNITLVLDTGSSLVWTQCKPCIKCRPQPLPIFDPSTSSTFSRLPCGSPECDNFRHAHESCIDRLGNHCTYTYKYGDVGPLSSRGTLSTDTLTIGASTFSGITFGCGDDNNDVDFTAGCGIAGFGWGPLSLPSQLGITKFSYCMSHTDKGTAFLGSEAVLEGSAAHTTPLVKKSISAHYNLIWKGITVADTRLPLPTDPSDSTIGRMYIDSGGVSMLFGPIFDAVEKAFVSRVKLPRKHNPQLPLCFEMPKGSSPRTLGVRVPKLVFHFQGADWEFPVENYMAPIAEDTMCLMFQKSKSGWSVLGMIQQFGTHVLHDLEKKTLSFVTGSSCPE